MYRAAEALKTFFSGFGYTAYQEDTVPDDVSLPYITYSLSIPEWTKKATMYARVWDRSKSNNRVTEISDQIAAEIGEGVKLEHDAGYLMIWPETPFAQIKADGDFRYAYINLSINAYNLPGT